MNQFSLAIILALSLMLQVSPGLSSASSTIYVRSSPQSLHNLYRDVASHDNVSTVLRCAMVCQIHVSCVHFFYSPITQGCVLVAVDPNMPLVSPFVYGTWDFYTSSGDTGCDDIYSKELSMCVRFSVDFLSWTEAKTACANMYGRLAVLDTEEKFTWIRYLMMTGSLFPNYNVGGEIQSGVFRWFNGVDVLSSMWGDNQPDNINGDEYCLCMMAASQNKLNDCGCLYWPVTYICEF